MGMYSLLESVQSNFLDRDNALSKEIIYTFYSDNTSVTSKCIVQEDDFRKHKKTEDVVADECSFMMVKLDTTPSKKDKITLDSMEWEVEDYRPNGMGRYDIYCYKDKHRVGGSISRNGY